MGKRDLVKSKVESEGIGDSQSWGGLKAKKRYAMR